MKQYCLNKDELSRFIDIEIDGRQLYEDEYELRIILDKWQSWDIELVCFATLFSHLLERRQKRFMDALLLLKRIYHLSEERGLGLSIEQIDEQFVDYMLKHVRRREITIEENLAQQDLMW